MDDVLLNKAAIIERGLQRIDDLRGFAARSIALAEELPGQPDPG